MRPDIKSDKPAKDEMGMDYIPVYSDEVEEAQELSGGQVDGRAGFTLSQARQQTIGVTTAMVEKRALSGEIRATGRVAFDPELFTAIEEYRLALSASGQMRTSSFETMRDQSRALLQSSRTKLKLMGLTDQQIRKIGRGTSDPMNLLLPEGKAWVYAEVFEYEVAGVKPGQKIEATAPSISGETFTGKVSSISPILNTPTRTVRVRAEVPDPKGLLRPDTFLNVKILNDLGQRLSIPEDSVMFTGEKTYAFVIQGEGRFEPVPVTLGQKSGAFYEVLSGLEAGQKVVTGANFLIDSESRFRSVVAPKAKKAPGEK
jgi:Cu(I)/Ag(I) efflux system membrane fusion protein